MVSVFNENHYRTFEASCETFSGFQVNINITKIDTIDDIIKIFTKKLENVLELNNLVILKEKLNVTKFHIHMTTIEEIFLSSKEDTLYICNHC